MTQGIFNYTCGNIRIQVLAKQKNLCHASQMQSSDTESFNVREDSILRSQDTPKGVTWLSQDADRNHSKQWIKDTVDSPR